ncbi:ricin-type beta-trefoil lectin domain protein [Kitasatospora sp. NPDC058965]|uniref:ricin-type beta-trefoil lectin domain protein n=1 Tax=Kitasatospora sp. NPDC058965 TaxID=3346682 RepID=UPI0036ACD485
MSHRGSPRPNRPRPLRGLSAVAVLATVLGGLATPAFAVGNQLPPGKDAPPAHNTPVDAHPGPAQQAQAEAKKTGKPVTVDALTTETSLTVANPDGSFTTTRHVQAARVKKGGAWVATDATLAKNADGTFSPAATPSGVTLSGGGTAPLAAFKDKAGHQFAMTLPFALPRPTVSGDTATYAEVLPGVDLQATVTDQGAFHEVLVVKNAGAAADPRLQTLKLATSTNGLTTSTDTDGNLTVKTADGQAAFDAPAPLMWDSAAQAAPTGATPHAGAAAAEAAPKARAISPDAPAAPAGSADPAGQVGSSKDGPGHGAHISKLKVTADSGSVTLVPDADQLAHATFPAFIDPYVNPHTGGTNHYTEVKEGCAGQALYDQAQTNGEGIGYQQYDSNCFGLYRTYYEMDTSYFNSSMSVQQATLNLTETYGADHGCGNQWGIGLNLTGGINGSTSWGSQPGYVDGFGTQNVATAASGCGNQSVAFDITRAVSQHLGYNNLTFLIYGNESKYSTNYGFMRFSTNPYTVTRFDVAPDVPTNTQISPQPQNPAGSGCTGGPAGWIGMTTLNGNASNITLSATVSTQMQGVNVMAHFHVWDNMVNNGSGGPTTATWPNGNWTATGGTSSANIGGPVSDGHTYGWNSWSDDGTLGSGGSPFCYFTADLSAPSLATFTPSPAFPPLGSGQTPAGFAGDTATVKVSSVDPTPSGCNLAACLASGVAKFEYALDQNIPAVGAHSVPATAGAGTSGTASIPITVGPGQWGTHTLYVRAIDKAGNTQATAAAYSFYAPYKPGAKVVAGDLNGDGIPDQVVPNPDGNLYLIPGNSDPGGIQVASTAANAPDGKSWNNFLVAHRSSESQGMVDDLFALNRSVSPKTLYVYVNEGTAGAPGGGAGTSGHFSNSGSSIQQQATKPQGCNGAGCTGYYSNSWDAVTQLVAPGAFSRLPQWQAAGLSPYADLITVENGRLWYYPGSVNAAAHFSTPTMISSDDWSNTTLIAPGVVGASVDTTTDPAHPATTGGTPTLWARNNTTGAITQYTLTFDANGQPTGNLSAPKSGLLTSGVPGNLCADITGANYANGTAPEVWGCAPGAFNQTFSLGTDGSLHIMGKCVDVSHSATAPKSPVDLWDCNNSGAQKWNPVAGTGQLQYGSTGLCLTVPGTPAAGVALVADTCVAGGTPSQNWAATTALPAQQPLLPLGVGANVYPTLTSPGDVTGDGNPELYVLNGTGQISEFPGTAPNAAGTAQFSGYQPQVLGPLHAANANWPLTTPVNGVVTDTTGAHNGTVGSGLTFVSDTVNGSATTVAAFPGVLGAEVDTAGTAVDTGNSFSITLWAKAAANGGVVASQDGVNSSGFILWPEQSDGSWRFGMGNTDDPNTWNYDQTTYPLNSAAAKVTPNQWTKLTASFDAATGRTALWVNGQLAGTGQHNARPGINGPLVIGRYKYKAGAVSPFKGSVSNVTVNDYAVPLTGTGPITSGMAGKCLDNDSGRTTDGNKVQIWDCVAGAPSETQWSINANGTITWGGACMNAAGNGTVNNTAVELRACDGGNNQQWIPRADGSVLNPASGRCLADPSSSVTNGTQLILWDCGAGYQDQAWHVSNLTAA